MKCGRRQRTHAFEQRTVVGHVVQAQVLRHRQRVDASAHRRVRRQVRDQQALVLARQAERRHDHVQPVLAHRAAAPLDRSDPFNPINRRISIIVMTKTAAEAAVGDGPKLEINGAAQLGAALPAVAPQAAPPAAR
mgnify:CR=1 FL=1